VEIFGAEKALDALARTTLFGPGRLTYELLACVRYPAPLPGVCVGDGPDVLVVENSDPYWAAVEVLRAREAGRVGIVVWGCGRSFPSQVTSLAVDVAGRGPVHGTTWYWGDLDPVGVDIAVAAAAAGGSAVDVQPARGLWASFAACPITDAGAYRWTDAGREWLGPQLWDDLSAARTAGGRVAQEAVSLDVLAGWAAETER
jgi:hypothetical protein